MCNESTKTNNWLEHFGLVTLVQRVINISSWVVTFGIKVSLLIRSVR